ncbi:MAG: cholesterol oxidase substrate-binding domain-containing protein, partial [Pseudomonadota bacterium]
FNYRITELAPKPISRMVTNLILSNPDLTPAFGVFMRGVSDLAVNMRFTPDSPTSILPRSSHDSRSLEAQLLDAASSNDAQYSREQMERLLSNDYIRGMLNAAEQTIAKQTQTRSNRPLLSNVSDIWGPAYHTLLYVTEHTLRVTANGYAVHLPFSEAQDFLYRFKTMYSALLKDYEARGLYPVNGPIEIRITNFSETSDIKAEGDIKPPALCALQKADGVEADVAIWLDLLGLTKTPSAGDFFTDLEVWLYKQYPPEQIKVEWSKGWAYSSTGAWSNDAFLKTTLPSTLNGSTRSMKECAGVFNQLDPNGLMSNAFLHKFL